MSENIQKNLETVKETISAASKKGGHPTARLVAVSKGHDREKITNALAAGHRIFGENRVQEAQAKWPDLKKRFPDVELHLIGPLQTNKVKDAVALFDVIETLDRPKLARKLLGEFEKTGRRVKLFIQVNTGEEPQKAGVSPGDLEGFSRQCRDLGLEISGLMCIPPFDEEPAMHFALLKKLGEKLGLKEISMGMTGDYEIAAALGATQVRVGTAVFGPRE